MRTLDPQSLPQHVDRLYRAAWALCGSREDAEDLVQETFARVLARTRVLRGDDELYYLMRVLRNTFFTTRRTAARRPVTVATLDDVMTSDPKPMGRPEQAIEIREVYSTIAALPEDFRLALVAVDVVGLSYRQAARALGVREATITTRLFRARKLMAKQLGSEPAAERSEATAGETTPGEAIPGQTTASEGARRDPRAREGSPTLGGRPATGRSAAAPLAADPLRAAGGGPERQAGPSAHREQISASGVVSDRKAP
jgi:RNA polymerase sigma-70 factor (ECF subfamily)